MANFTCEGRESSIIKDVQRSFMFQVSFPTIGYLVDPSLTSNIVEELTVRARSIAIPSRGIETAKTEFMGMSQLYPMKPSMTQTVAITFMESQNLNMFAILNDLLQKTFSYKTGHSTLVGPKRSAPTSYAQDLHINLLKYDGTPATNKTMVCKNAFLTNVEDISLSFASNDVVQIGTTWSFDLMYFKSDDEVMQLEL